MALLRQNTGYNFVTVWKPCMFVQCKRPQWTIVRFVQCPVKQKANMSHEVSRWVQPANNLLTESLPESTS